MSRPLPGTVASQTPPSPDDDAREKRALRQENEQLRGQLAQASARNARTVTDWRVVGSVAKVTYSDGHVESWQLP